MNDDVLPYELTGHHERHAPACNTLPPPAERRARTVNLALQGGGAHGAFTWGVLDRLLEDETLHFEGLSGSSAGALNAAVLASGWARGGREGARAALASFWHEVGTLMPPGMVTTGSGDAIALAPASKLLASWVAQFSPVQLNPMGVNPLRDLLERQVDFEALRMHSPFKLFVGATQASTGRLRVFREHELTVDVLLASACLPRLHHPVEIDGEPYWDGGYSANPAVFPLFYDCDAADVLLVLLSPLVREAAPRTSEQIQQRIVEMGFSANFMREMQTFARAAHYAGPSFVTRGRLERKLQTMRFHMIDATEVPSMQRPDTQLLAHTPYLELLHGQGRERAAEWLAAHGEKVGRRASLDLQRFE